jgi:hypothetical protein
MSSKNYWLHLGGNRRRDIEGQNIIDAIEANFGVIAKESGIGNAAGYIIDEVCIEYNHGILGGTGGAELTITAHGQTPANGKTDVKKKVSTAWIGGVSAKEIPEKYFFEVK